MKDQCLPSDIINTMPQNVIEMILTLMPIRDAVRTSILARKWRYNWVKIPKLVFDDKLFDDKTVDNRKRKRCKIFNAIYQVLLLHKGPILEFTLNWLEVGNSFEHILFLLSRNKTLKKFTFSAKGNKLPSEFYSLLQLTHLNLRHCEVPSPPVFIGFNMLTSISLEHVKTTDEALLYLLADCPILKHFSWIATRVDFAFEEEDSIVPIFKCLNVIEHLELDLAPILWFFTEGIPRKLTTSLVYLKHLVISELLGPRRLSFILLLIRSSPNLEKFKITMDDDNDDVELGDFVVPEDYDDVRLDHLTEFEFIYYYRNTAFELKLLKLILVKSPVLKKVCLKHADVGIEKVRKKKLRSLLRLPRASPALDISIQRIER